jgi:hypothetical protein
LPDEDVPAGEVTWYAVVVLDEKRMPAGVVGVFAGAAEADMYAQLADDVDDWRVAPFRLFTRTTHQGPEPPEDTAAGPT